jgi:hypothetical protein
MKRFDITLARTVTELFYIAVDAENRDEAQRRADYFASNSSDDEWERDTISSVRVQDISETEIVESSPQQSPWAGY